MTVSSFQESRTAAILFDKADFERYDNECFHVVLMTHREMVLLDSASRMALWPARWVDRDIDWNLASGAIGALVPGCLDDLIKSNLLMVAALTGTDINFTGLDVSDYLTGYHDFRQRGLANRLGPEGLHDNQATVRDELAGLREAIEALVEQDYSDELTEIVGKLEAVALVLGV